MKRLVLSAKAEQCLQSQYLHIASNRNIEVANKVIAGLDVAMEQLTIYPRLGKVGHNASTRQLIFPPYIITYQVRKDCIYIVSVLRGSQRRP